MSDYVLGQLASLIEALEKVKDYELISVDDCFTFVKKKSDPFHGKMYHSITIMLPSRKIFAGGFLNRSRCVFHGINWDQYCMSEDEKCPYRDDVCPADKLAEEIAKH